MRSGVRCSLEWVATVSMICAMTFAIVGSAHAGLDNELTLVDGGGERRGFGSGTPF